jgi:hypothetical protein
LGVQVEAAQSAKYPWQKWKSGLSAATPARAVGGANAMSMPAMANTTFAMGLPCTARGNPLISSLHFKRSKLVLKFLLVVNQCISTTGFLQAARRIQ